MILLSILKRKCFDNRFLLNIVGKDATVVDSMFTAKINYSPFHGSILMRFHTSKPHNSFCLPLTTPLNLLQNDNFAIGQNRRNFMPLIFSQ